MVLVRPLIRAFTPAEQDALDAAGAYYLKPGMTVRAQRMVRNAFSDEPTVLVVTPDMTWSAPGARLVLHGTFTDKEIARALACV